MKMSTLVKSLVTKIVDFSDFMDRSQDDLTPKERSKQTKYMIVSLTMLIAVFYSLFLMLFY